MTTTSDITTLFAQLCEALPKGGAAFRDAVELQTRAWRTRSPETARQAGAAFRELTMCVQDAEGLPVSEDARRVLLDLVGRAVVARGGERLN